MAKDKKQENTSKKPRQKRDSNLSEEQKKEVTLLREKMADIRNQGKFSKYYTLLRKETVVINLDKSLTESEKKDKLIELCEKVIEDIEADNVSNTAESETE